MKKIIVLGLTLIVSYSTYAKNVKLNIKTLWKKGEITKNEETTVLAKLGHEWIIPFTDTDSLKIKMTISDNTNLPLDFKKKHGSDFKADLYMQGIISVMDNGTEKIIASPRVISNYDKEVMMTTENEAGDYLEIKITPSPVSKNI